MPDQTDQVDQVDLAAVDSIEAILGQYRNQILAEVHGMVSGKTEPLTDSEVEKLRQQVAALTAELTQAQMANVVNSVAAQTDAHADLLGLVAQNSRPVLQGNEMKTAGGQPLENPGAH